MTPSEGPLSSRALLLAIVAMVPGMIADCDAAGLDARPQLLPLLALEAQATRRSNPISDAYLDRFLHPTRDDQIAYLYEQLAALADDASTNELVAAEYQARFAELRTLQAEEASEWNSSRALDPADLDALLARADAELDDDANSPRSS